MIWRTILAAAVMTILGLTSVSADDRLNVEDNRFRQELHDRYYALCLLDHLGKVHTEEAAYVLVESCKKLLPDYRKRYKEKFNRSDKEKDDPSTR